MEEEYATKLKDLEERHRSELAALGGSDDAVIPDETNNNNDRTNNINIDTAETIAAIARQKKLEQIRQQKEAERQRILAQERQSIEDAQNVGPTRREIELEQITQQLQPHQLRIQPVPADGNCLFRAIAAQCSISSTTSTTTTTTTYQDIRALCAQTMRDHESEFAPFCEYDNSNNGNNDHDDTTTTATTNYQEYIHAVQHSSHHWGGHLELRALSMALQRPIHVYSSHTLTTNGPLIIDASTSSSSSAVGDTEDSSVEPIRLSYHLHYYALGEHYNQVVKVGHDEAPSNDER